MFDIRTINYLLNLHTYPCLVFFHRVTMKFMTAPRIHHLFACPERAYSAHDLNLNYNAIVFVTYFATVHQTENGPSSRTCCLYKFR